MSVMEAAALDALAASDPHAGDVRAWAADEPAPIGDYERDAAFHAAFWMRGLELQSALPPKPRRSQPEQALAEHILHLSRDRRVRFLETHGAALYARLTGNLSSHRRVEELANGAAAAIPGLVPAPAVLAAEAALAQKDKDGHEVDQGLLFNRFLASGALPRPLPRDLTGAAGRVRPSRRKRAGPVR